MSTAGEPEAIRNSYLALGRHTEFNNYITEPRSAKKVRIFRSIISTTVPRSNLGQAATTLKNDLQHIHGLGEVPRIDVKELHNMNSPMTTHFINQSLTRMKPKSNLFNSMLTAALAHFRTHDYKNIWLGINRSALLNNIAFIKSQADSNKKLCAIVKCDAYGHSIKVVAPAIDSHVDSYGVTENQEAMHLRLSSQKPIMRVRLADTFEIFDSIQKKLCIQELVGSLSQAKMIASCVEEAKADPIEIHVSLDATQMGRDGFPVHPETWKDVLADIKSIDQIPQLKIVGITTHLPNSDAADYAVAIQPSHGFVLKALEVQALLKNPEGVDIHGFASAGALRSSKVPGELLKHITMNRAGVSIFGQRAYATEDISPLQHVMNACTFVSDTYVRKHGDTVGYGSLYKVSVQQEQHANVPGGWHLLPRESLSNEGTKSTGVAPIKLLNELGGTHTIIGNPSMNSIVCKAESEDTPHILHPMEPVFFMADKTILNGGSTTQDSNTIGDVIAFDGVRVTTQIGNPNYSAHLLIDV